MLRGITRTTCIALLMNAGAAFPLLAGDLHVRIDTSAVRGSRGAVAFDFVSDRAANNDLFVLDFHHDGTTALPETQGGLVEGDIILLQNPAHHTMINDGSFFNQLIVPFSSFGDRIEFTLHATHTPSSDIPDSFSFFLLDDATRLSALRTSDPLGAQALFAVTIDGSEMGLFQSFEPAVFIPPDTIEIVVRSRPPVCSEAALLPADCWPPNHGLQSVEIVGVTDPDGDPVTIVLTGITQDEPVRVQGSGQTAPDGILLDLNGDGEADSAQVRCERQGGGNGRVYAVHFTASDGLGGECNGRATLCVPHDRRPSAACVDDGQLFDSTTPRE